MKTFLAKIMIFLGLIAGSAACSSENWETIPKPIADFLTEYFPLQAVSNCGYSDDVWHVKLRNSVALTFDDRYKWTSINGYGNTLPETLLFDELPPALYAYLQELSLTDGVYSVKRDNYVYNITLLDSSVTYTIATGIVTPDVPASSTIAHLRMKQREIER